MHLHICVCVFVSQNPPSKPLPGKPQPFPSCFYAHNYGNKDNRCGKWKLPYRLLPPTYPWLCFNVYSQFHIVSLIKYHAYFNMITCLFYYLILFQNVNNNNVIILCLFLRTKLWNWNILYQYFRENDLQQYAN